MRRLMLLSCLVLGGSAFGADYGNYVQSDGSIRFQTIGTITGSTPSVAAWAFWNFYQDECSDNDPPFAFVLREFDSAFAFNAPVSASTGNSGADAVVYPAPTASTIIFSTIGASQVTICSDPSVGQCSTLISQHAARTTSFACYTLSHTTSLLFSAFVDFYEVQSPCGLTSEIPEIQYQAMIYHVDAPSGVKDLVAHANSATGVPSGSPLTNVTPPGNPDQYTASGQFGTTVPPGTTCITAIAVDFKQRDFDISGDLALNCDDVVILRRRIAGSPPAFSSDEIEQYNFDASGFGLTAAMNSADAYHLMTLVSEVVGSCRRGDGSGDGIVDCCDRETLEAAIAMGPVPDGDASYDVRFDFDMNGQLDGSDFNRLTPLIPPRAGDANRDCKINFQDITDVLSVFGFTVGPWNLGDANGDGVANFNDITDILAGFGASACP